MTAYRDPRRRREGLSPFNEIAVYWLSPHERARRGDNPGPTRENCPGARQDDTYRLWRADAPGDPNTWEAYRAWMDCATSRVAPPQQLGEELAGPPGNDYWGMPDGCSTRASFSRDHEGANGMRFRLNGSYLDYWGRQ